MTMLMIERALGAYIQGFHRRLRRVVSQNGDLATPALRDFVDREYSRAVAWVPGRMIDDVEAMLASYRRNENEEGVASLTSRLPIMFVATAKDFSPIDPMWGRQITENLPIVLPGDAEGRCLRVRVMRKDVRAQAVFVAAEKYTAGVMAEVFLHQWLKAHSNRSFTVDWQFQGIPTGAWPVQVDASASAPALVPVDGVKNLTILALDFNLRPAVPVFDSPEQGEPMAEGATNPAGFPVVVDAERTVEEVR